MQRKRILVLGCPGSGKTTFALRLAEVTGLPVVHLDKLFWLRGWVLPSQTEFHAKLEDELSKDAWIMDGNYGSSLPLRLQYCQLVIYMDKPRFVCMWGILSRYLKNKGKTRPDMADDCLEKIDREFIRYTWHFHKGKSALNKSLVQGSGKPVIWLRSRRQANHYLSSITNEILDEEF